jgi:uncharacterized metal-binding protein
VDCFGEAEGSLREYVDGETARLHRAAAAVEARYYGKLTRLAETERLAKALGARRLGLAFCTGLREEAQAVAEFLRESFEVISVCCKACGLSKDALGHEKIDPGRGETACNPVAQARVLNRAATQLNIICGLCVGHDAIFSMYSKAPATTLIAKDRVLAHNPAGAVYCQYVRRQLPTRSGEAAFPRPSGSVGGSD